MTSGEITPDGCSMIMFYMHRSMDDVRGDNS